MTFRSGAGSDGGVGVLKVWLLRWLFAEDVRQKGDAVLGG
jgi:hypothetical protein